MSENTRKTSNEAKEARKALIRKAYDKCIEKYGKTLERLAKH